MSHSTVALLDRSHWGRLHLLGSGGIDYLHSQTTQDIKRLQPGEGCDTVFITSTAHIVDLVTVYRLSPTETLLFTSPQQKSLLIDWIQRLLVFSRGTQLQDRTEQTRAFSLIGSGSTQLLASLGITNSVENPYGSHVLTQIAGIPVRVAVGTGLTLPGYTLIMDAEVADPIWQTLLRAGSEVLSPEDWERIRIQDGRPLAGAELTEDYNPLEAGLWDAVSLSKGCYIGQEVLAKQTTYQRLRQRLWGIRLTAAVPVGTAITLAEDKVGVLTSIVDGSEGTLGLGYVRSKVDREGLEVQLGEVIGILVRVPYLTFAAMES